MINFTIFRKITLFSGDLFLLFLSLIITLIIGFGQSLSETIIWQHILPFSLLFIIWIIIFVIFDFYELDMLKSGFSLTIKIGIGLLVCLIIGIIFFYLIPYFGVNPKTNLLTLIFILWILLIIWRKIALNLFSSYFQNRVAIIGLTEESKNLALAFKKNPQMGYNLIEIIPVQNISLLSKKIKEFKLNTIIIAKNLSSEAELDLALYKCLPLKINFLNLAQAYEIVFQKIPLDFVEYVWFLENLKEGKKKLYDKTKRFTDILFGSSLLLITLPFWLLIAIFIKIDSKGSVFYKQKRVGKDGNEFWLIKFRSMQDKAEQNEAVWAQEKDPRRTRVGQFLRSSHLDELPQMFNIIKGDISLIGPRPERPEFVKELEKQIPHYHLRHLIKPGFTGWAQTKFHYGRTIQDSFEKFQYDLYYIKNRSPFLDLLVFLKTFQLFFKKE
jgi:exopolysaccharide biosynthesis polyprenyl glycosylphosphotransferase